LLLNKIPKAKLSTCHPLAKQFGHSILLFLLTTSDCQFLSGHKKINCTLTQWFLTTTANLSKKRKVILFSPCLASLLM